MNSRIRHDSLTFLVVMGTLLSSCSNNGDKIEPIDLFPVQEGGSYGFIDRSGSFIVPTQFSDASLFHEGLALVRGSGQDPKWGFIDKDGKFAIPATYESATDFKGGMAWVVSEGSAPAVIGTKGEQLFILKDAENVDMFSEDMAAFSIKGKPQGEASEGGGFEEHWGFVNAKGIEVIKPQFDEVGAFHEGFCVVKDSTGRWGFINKNGEYVIPARYEEAGAFHGGRAAVRIGSKWGVIDREGKITINPQFDEIQIDGSGYFVKLNDSYGWCDNKGEFTINAQFEAAFPFWSEELAPVVTGKKWGYVDRDGKVVINYQFNGGALPFNSGCAIVSNDRKVGIIDTKGKYIVAPTYGAVSDAGIQYLAFHTYKYHSIRTDYFNTEAIISSLNFTKPGGMAMDMTYGQIMNKLGSLFQAKEHMTLEDKGEISDDASYNLAIRGYPMKAVTVDHPGVYSYQTQEWQLDSTAHPICYVYSIGLHGRGSGKAKLVADAIGKSLSGYEKVGPAVVAGISYTSPVNTVIIESLDNEVKIRVYPPDSLVDPRDPEAQGD